MVFLTPEDGASAVELLKEHEPAHLVGEGHPAEGEEGVGPTAESIGETKRAANSKDELPTSSPSHLRPPQGELLRPHLPAQTVEDDEVTARFDLRLNAVALSAYRLLPHCLPQDRLSPNHRDLNRHVMTQPGEVILYSLPKIGLTDLAHEDEMDFHGVDFTARMKNSRFPLGPRIEDSTTPPTARA